MKAISSSRRDSQGRVRGFEQLESRLAFAGVNLLPSFDISPTAGAPAWSQIWVDTVAGRDANSGASRSLPTMNIYDCRHLYLIGLDVSAGGGDVVHLDHCSHVLLRSTTIRGLGTLANDAAPQEALKVNQSRISMLNSAISPALGITPSTLSRFNTAMLSAAGSIALATGRCM